MAETGLAEEEYSDLSEWELWEAICKLPGSFRQQFYAPEICFTGFGRGKEKAMLQEIARMNGYIVRDDVTKNLTFLCCGPEPGPAKIEKAEFRQVEIIPFIEFLEMIGVEST
jgi:NAD-dependent DNA ligase